MKQIFNDLPLAAIHLDEETRILQANEQANKLFAWQTIPADPPFFTEFLQKDEIATFSTFFNSIDLLRSTIYNTTLHFSAEKVTPVSINASLTGENNRIFLLNRQDTWKSGCEESCLHAAILEAQYQNNPGGILLVSESMKMLSFNREFVNMWGIPPDVQASRDEKASLQTILNQLEDPQGFIAKVEHLYRNRHETSTDEVRLKDSRTFYRHTYPIYDRASYLARVWYFLDITPLKHAQHQLEKQQIFQNSILEHVQDGIIACDEQGKIVLVNRAGRDLYNIKSDSKVFETFAKIDHYQRDGITPLPHYDEPLVKALVGGNLQNDEIVFIGEEEKKHTLRVNGQVMSDGEGYKIGAVISLHDITDLRAAEEKLRFFAYHDELTGLPNRRLFHDLLLQILKQAYRNELFVGVLFLDLDNFKAVNDQYGHQAGDQLLIKVSNTLKSCLRDSDILCRWGGDEFIIGLPSSKNGEGVVNVAEKICGAVQRCIDEESEEFHVSVSIGIAISPTHGNDPDRLIRNADIAMYRAKRAGKNRCELFSRKF